MRLRDCAPGDRLTLRRLRVRAGERLRLLELGFVPGALLHVIARGATGGLLVGLGDARVALDGATAGALLVEPDVAR
ncbi:ferrous iron transport protein A [Streptomyces sp. RY43-2]|uniref:Ferrous iron transport protein A n=2 Tax=Streptomyces TaxID=1883 RepID=A0ABT0ZJT2_9ACTN|nr:FeoA family protein [Streptomyces macrolidinus]MCN9243806.1 ferrous iron transport protein A [Streptomyces macrolidinus]